MKRLTAVLMAVISVLFSWELAFAVKGPQGIAHTDHNLSTTNPYTTSGFGSKNETEICIFCHTPHGGNLDGPLWNRITDDPGSPPYGQTPINIGAAGYFTHYNSMSLSPYLQGLSTTRQLYPESLMCMTCHDGTIAVNRVVNVSNSTPLDPLDPLYIESKNSSIVWIDASWIGPEKKIGSSPELVQSWDMVSGGDLKDDHPVSFDYEADQISKGASHLRDISVVRTKGIRFFPDDGTGTRLECSSCHDPHVNYGKYDGLPGYNDPAYTQYSPFLITSNQGSAMCLACHVK